ncbi:hypothetical protein V494_04120 [Pseudogymnoascus sp. VKM F-4513 (FW-928)]|nr:hypothetical protein V494_04120 [Pseudogymnoascus sp. VKM F-4513 (FW-928)]
MYFWKQRHDKLPARAACGEERLQPGGPLGGRVLDALPGLSSGKIGLWRQATAARSGQDVSYSIVGSECLRDDKFGSAILIAGVALLQSSHLTNQPLTESLRRGWNGKAGIVVDYCERLVDVSAGLPGIRVKNNDLIPHHVYWGILFSALRGSLVRAELHKRLVLLFQLHADHLLNSKLVGRPLDFGPQGANPLSDSLCLPVIVSARGLSNNGRGDDWGVLGTATKKALFWNAVCTQRVQCVAPKMSVRNAAEAAGSQAHYAALYNATERVMLHDKLGDAGDDRGEETGGEQGLDIVGCAELAAFSYSSQS